MRRLAVAVLAVLCIGTLIVFDVVEPERHAATTITATFVAEAASRHPLPSTSTVDVDTPHNTTTTTYAGCFNDTYPFLRNGGVRRHNSSHVVVLAVPGSNVAQIQRNISSCSSSHVVILAPVEITVPSTPSAAVSQDTSITYFESRDEITAVAWLAYASVPFHDLYYPTGYLGRHALLTEFARREWQHRERTYSEDYDGVKDASVDISFRTVMYNHHVVPPRFSGAALHHYGQLFAGEYPQRGLQDGDEVRAAGTLMLIHSADIRKQFWKLPFLNASVALARRKLEEYMHSPATADLAIHSRKIPSTGAVMGPAESRVLVEMRAFRHRQRHLQFRGYRPAVWEAIEAMARRNNFALDVVDMKALSFRRQLEALYQRKYVIVTEGSFSVWVPFLRKGTVCMMMYDHYGSGWMIPKVHLPVALLGSSQRRIRMVLVSLYNRAVPSAELLETEFLLSNESAGGVRVVSVPDDPILLQYLSSVDGEQ